MNARQIRQARRMISGKGYYNMRIMQYRSTLRHLCFDFDTCMRDAGGSENLPPHVCMLFVRNYARIKRRIAWYESRR